MVKVGTLGVRDFGGAGLESSEDPCTHVSSRVAHVGDVLFDGAVVAHCNAKILHMVFVWL